MTTYDNNMSGILSKNSEKDESHPKWPDYKGHVEIDGQRYWLSAWLRDGNRGKFMSLSLKRAEPLNSAAGGASKPRQSTSADDDAIPF